MMMLDPYRLTGTILKDKYELLSFKGSGGMGAVYLSQNVKTKEKYAVKILKPDIAVKDPEYVRLFEQEIESTKKLKHPNIVTIYESGSQDNISFFIMEWLEGNTLENIINKRLSFDTIIEIFRQICDALITAHDENILHLDIKPGNIFLLWDSNLRPNVKVIDFGLARIISTETGTTASIFRGTNQFCSPEHYGGKLTARSDIYSLGATLYSVITGDIPFTYSYMYAKLNGNKDSPSIPSIYNERTDFPQGFDEIIEKALKKDPLERHKSMQHFFEELETLIDHAYEENHFEQDILGESYQPTLFEKMTSYFTSSGAISSVDLAIDIGTSNTRIFVRGEGVVSTQPSCIMLNELTGELVAAGYNALAAKGRESRDRVVIEPIKEGIITDIENAGKMLNHFLLGLPKNYWRKRKVAVAVYGNMTGAESFILDQTLRSLNLGEIFPVEMGLAAAIGAGLPTSEPNATMIVDIGSGKTEISVVSSSGIVITRTERTAGNTMNNAIFNYIRQNRDFELSDTEEIKIQMGNAIAPKSLKMIKVKGRVISQGIPGWLDIIDQEVFEAIAPVITEITNGIRNTLDQTPPEISVDIFERGIVLTGGGSLLSNLDQHLLKQLNIPIILADNPLLSVILGLGKSLEN